MFSYEAADPTQPACVLIRDMSGPAAGGESIGEMARFEAEQGKIYIDYALAEDAAAPYNLPAFITDRENNAVYQFDIVMEESGDGYTAQLREVGRKAATATPPNCAKLRGTSAKRLPRPCRRALEWTNS